MKTPGFRIAWLMAFVAIAAINFWAYRACYYYSWTNEAGNANKLDVLYTGSVPMANVLLACGLLTIQRPRAKRAFLMGFVAFGVAALAVYLTLVSFYCHELVRPYLFRFQNHVFDTIGRSRAHITIFRFAAGVILGWPQLAFALIGGLLSRRVSSVKR